MKRLVSRRQSNWRDPADDHHGERSVHREQMSTRGQDIRWSKHKQDCSSAKRISEATGWPGLVPMEAMLGVNKKAMAAMLDFNGTLCSHMMTINSERVAFVHNRLNEDYKLWQQLAVSRSPNQIFEAYSSFLQTAFEQYQGEFAHMLKLGQAFASWNSDLLARSVETTLRESARRDALSTAQPETASCADPRRRGSAA